MQHHRTQHHQHLPTRQEKASRDLAEAESKRAALEEERKSLREEAEKAEGLGQALAHEKAVVETSRKVKVLD